MTIGTWFRIRPVIRPLLPGELRLEEADGGVVVKEGVFVTEQSLASFPGAVTGIEILSRFTRVFVPSWDQHIVSAVWSIIAGIILFGISIYESWPRSTASQIGSRIFVALVNTGMLFLTTTGVDTTIGGATATGG
jgi:hypothetical protein